MERFSDWDTSNVVNVPATSNQILSVPLGFLSPTSGGVIYLKARSTLSNGLFSESPEILVDARPLAPPDVSIQNLGPNQLTVFWKSVGTPQASSFLVRLTDPYNVQTTASTAPATGHGIANVSYSQQFTGLKSNTKYRVEVMVYRDLWQPQGPIGSTTVMTPPPAIVTTTIAMNESQVDEGNIPYVGTFGPILPGPTIITNVNFPAGYSAVWLVRQGYSTENCGDTNASVLVSGDMTAAQEATCLGETQSVD